MALWQEIRQLRTMRPFELRSWLDDRLLGVYNQLQRAKERQLPAEVRRLLALNARLHRRHAGERCFVIGNGPSLNDQDLTRLHDRVTFAVNRFIHHPQAEEINPTYYCITDPKFGTGAWGTDFVEQLEQRLPNTILFLTYEGWRLVEDRGIVADHEKYVILPNQQYHFGYDRPIDLTRGIPGSSNVTKAALSIAAYMGVAEICLLGIDGNGLILEEGSHFYGHEPRPKDQRKFETDLMSMSMGMRGWRAIEDYLRRRNIALYSMNPRSVLTDLTVISYDPDGASS